MFALLDTSEDLAVCAAELGAPVGQFFSPLNGFLPQEGLEICGGDNGGFTDFDPAAFMKKLERLEEIKHLFKFVACPDVVVIKPDGKPIGDARRTLEVFEYWYPRICDWPVALVAQDGLENIEIPKWMWDVVSAIFIGGSTKWKLSIHAAAIIKAARAMEKWVHVGRVNTPERWQRFEKLKVDSVDGTGISRFSHMRIAIRDRKESAQNGLFTSEQFTSTEAEGYEEVLDMVT